MKVELTAQQKEAQASFRVFAQNEIIPIVEQYDQEERTPPELIQKMMEAGYLGALAPKEYGGTGYDMVTLGLLHEAIGYGCSSIRSLLTVHSMVIHALLRWGVKQQKDRWLSRLASGAMIGAFGLSEPQSGSDANSIKTEAILRDDKFVLNGTKKWMTYGQIANLFLIFAKYDNKISAFMVERSTPGFSVEPLHAIFGTRASMLAELHLNDCVIPRENMIGSNGFGLASVVTTCLDIGRYSVAWGSVGIAQACLDASLKYSSQRQQFGMPIKEYQLVQQMITNMIVGVEAARLLCYQAGYLKEEKDPDTVVKTWIAKYFASTTASQSARDALQIHGANGCTLAYPLQRYLRDSTVMEIIEGSTQIQQMTIARYGYQGLLSTY